ncbi:hypothetical protein [uncultured Jatrophihabitans sp.]|uniref:hypothetical protein n=1 Tax=uncultured Jatrophihabitans sp. TaxID=1610747 RepID=UPI0035CB28AD
MQPFAGAEPLVGEVVALRTFRVEESGLLLPLYSEQSWTSEQNTATCTLGNHQAPADNCDCGFYAYGSPRAAAQNRGMRYVQAVVSCWGGVVAGTQGVRAQHARIDGLWLHPEAPPWLRKRVAARYPSTRLYDTVDALLTAHPLSVLPSYTPVGPRDRRPQLAAGIAGSAGLALGALPLDVLRGSAVLWACWLAAVGLVGAATLWCCLGARFPGRLVAAGIAFALTAWLVAPLFGLAGWLLRLPVLRGALVAVGSFLLTLRPHYFPVVTPKRERVYYTARA